MKMLELVQKARGDGEDVDMEKEEEEMLFTEENIANYTGSCRNLK